MLFNTMINNILYKYTTPTIHPFSDGFEPLVFFVRKDKVLTESDKALTGFQGLFKWVLLGNTWMEQ